MQAVRPKQSQKANNKQSTDTQQITAQESLAAIKVLIHTGVGCVTFLRGIFPERVFRDERLDALIDLPDSNGNKGRSSVKVKILQRGLRSEADAVLDTLDGISDALERGYLETLLLGIFLDPDHPFQLAELYAFNFVYRELDAGNGAKAKVPEVEIRDQLRNKHISFHNARSIDESGVCFSPAQRDKWTIGDVKRQAQMLVKQLVSITQMLETLPHEKYLNFKLYYTPETPEDYQPPKFRHVDPEVAKFTVGTKSANDVPETNVFGKFDAGHHCMTIRMMTIVKQLPDQDVLQASQTKPPLLKAEASQRPCLWSAEDMVVDEECEISFETLSEVESNNKARQPLGLTGSDGSLDPDSQIASGHLPHGKSPKTYTYSLPPDLPQNGQEDTDLKERLRLAATSGVPYTIETQSVPRMATDCQRSSPNEQLSHPPLNFPRRRRPSNVSDLLQATQTLPRGAALACEESSIAFSSLFQARPVPVRRELLEEDGIEEPPKQTTQPLDGNPIPSSLGPPAAFPPPSSAQTTAPQEVSNSSARAAASASLQQTADSLIQALSTVAQSGKMELNVGEAPLKHAQMPKSLCNTPNAAKASSSGLENGMEWPASDAGDEIVEELDCDCGNNDDSEGLGERLVSCDICRSWKHLSCYGDTRQDIPDDEPFICYNCQILPKDSDLLPDTERARRANVLEELFSLTLFRRLLYVFYNDGIYTQAKAVAKRMNIGLQTAKGLLQRAKAEEYLVVCTVLAEDSMELTTKTTKPKHGRPKKPKASDYKANHSAAILKRKEERYFTPGAGEEKEIKQKLGSRPATVAQQTVNTCRGPSAEVPQQSTYSSSASLVKPIMASGKTSAFIVPISPSRKVLEDISNSPRANRVAPIADTPAPPVTLPAIRNANPFCETNDVESFLPTPQTVERSSAPPAPPKSSEIQDSVPASSQLPAIRGRKTSYKALVSRTRTDAQSTASAGLQTGPQNAKVQMGVQSAVSAAFAQEAFQTSQEADLRLPVPINSPRRKRTASEVAPEPLHQRGHTRHSSPRLKFRKASMAEPIRARDERDEMEEEFEDMAMADFDGSATEYSTDARR